MNEMDDVTKNRIAQGMTIEQFLESAVGRYLVGRAESERTEVLEELAVIDPFDGKEVCKLQQRIAVVDSWQQWLAEALTDANQAEQEFLNHKSPDSSGA